MVAGVEYLARSKQGEWALFLDGYKNIVSYAKIDVDRFSKDCRMSTSKRKTEQDEMTIQQEIQAIETQMGGISDVLKCLQTKRETKGLTFDEDMAEDDLKVRYFELADKLESARDLDIATS